MELEYIRQELLSNRVMIIDVREKNEWDSGHLKHAIHFPFSQIIRWEIPSCFPTEIPVYLHCARGRRSAIAAEILKKDFSNVTALNIDFTEFHKHDFPME